MLHCTLYSQTAVDICSMQRMKLDCTEFLLRCAIRPLCIRTCGIQTTGNESFTDSKLVISVGSIFNDIRSTLPSVYMDQNCFCFVTALNKVLVVCNSVGILF